MNQINSKSVKTETTKTYQKYGLELITTKTEQNQPGIYFTVHRYNRTFYTANIVSLIAKRELGMY